eukprot:m.108875 g.108875  ORF g.108875 m.108875 type:complete len:1297 (-) comp9197_c0_seq2:751-4641(-)
MSTVDKLIVQGIRSFDPSSHQAIEFLKPMTVIIGHNGCGKTTIIECLKYIATGQYPPGSQGKAFVHDPKIAGETTVTAFVKLQFSNISGQVMVAQRILEAKQTRRTEDPSIRAVEGALTFEKEDGTTTKLSTRCTDLDQQMMIYLGVSKSILSNVIFCHQEEAAWPLSEPKKLKMKFDEIFSSTRYIKALDSIKKIRTEQNQEVKTLTETLVHLSEAKRNAHDIRKRAEMNKEECEKIELEIFNKDEELEPIEAELAKFKEISDELQDKQTKCAVLKSRKTELRHTLEEDEQSLFPLLSDTTPDLKKKVANFEKNLDKKQHHLGELESSQKECHAKLVILEKRLQTYRVDVGGLKQAQKTYEIKQKELHDAVVELATELNYAGDIAPGVFDKFLQKKITDFEKERKETKARFDYLEQQYSDIFEQKQLQFSNIKASQASRKTAETKLQKQIEDLNKKISKTQKSAGDTSQFEQRKENADDFVVSCKDEIEVFDRSNNPSKWEEEEKKLTKEIKLAYTMIEAGRKDMIVQERIKGLTSTLELTQSRYDELWSSHGERIKAIVGERTDVKTFLPALKRKMSAKEKEREKNNKNRESVMRKLASKQAELKNIQQQVDAVEKQYKEWQEELKEACGGQSLEESMSHASENLNKARQMSDLRPAMSKVYKMAFKKSNKDKRCFFCQRGFSNDSEEGECLGLMQEKVDQTLEGTQSDKRQLMELQGVVDGLTKLSVVSGERESLPQHSSSLKSKLSMIEDETMSLQNDLQSRVDLEDDLKTWLEKAKELEDVCKTLVQDHQNIRSVEASLKSEEKKLSENGHINQEELSYRKKELEEKREDVFQKKTVVGNERSKLQEKLRQAEKTASDYSYALIEVQRVHDQINTMRNQKDGMKREREETRQKRKSDEEKVQRLADEVDEAKNKVEESKQQKEVAMDEIERGAKRIHRCMDRFQAIHKDVVSYQRSGQKEKLEMTKVKIEDMEAQLETWKGKKRIVANEYNELSIEIETQNQVKQNIADNIRFREKKEQLQQLTREHAQLEVELQELSAGGQINIEELEALKIELEKEKSNLEGRKDQLKESIKMDEKELKTNLYKDIDHRHKETSVTIEATTQVEQDLQKYYNALDNAIVQFHSLKMETVNRTIREMWQKTYKGADIDYIEISSESSKGTDKLKRNYQYRVMMVKGNTKLQMRGRCSAGQKVMASIIIRLALADSFCANCGVLTLDEPTTNLDRENIESLAKCIAEIVKERKEKTANFQLLLITHDEEFLSLLHRESLGRVYYRVSKNADGHSVIEQASA